ncbi:NADAR family protein [Nocardiopsis sp. RSe5-2]|uniref:NADAR family protein n=1 Tax=Nocardiopsis endophytica TaxID=3018445 RepID=A0ABT4TXK6_9ACTN|nr:NADAR family protein [Nocardiopsis endophytica]MDA2809409.1 NADAR family protein [Nocardiopsis endophytica]
MAELWNGTGDTLTRESLAEASARGERLRFLFFWGHAPGRDGSVGKGCLSQWWPAGFDLDGEHYATAEHWMMAGKARLFGDERAAARVLEARTPGEAKSIGRGVAGFDEEVWRAHRFDLVVRGSVEKFRQNPELGAFLLATGGRVLVEASPRDRIWGIGLSESDERAADPGRWKGENLLGFALMRARDLLVREG